MDWSPVFITSVGGASAAIIGALGIATSRILVALRDTRRLVVAGQDVQKARGVVRDKKIGEIHVLVNSRLLTVLRLLVLLTKKEADRTNNKDDIAAYQTAMIELTRAQEAAKLTLQLQGANNVEDTVDDSAVASAEEKLDALKVHDRDIPT